MCNSTEEMANITYSVLFKIFEKSWPVPTQVRHLLVGEYNCALRRLVETTFATDPYWKYEERVEIALFVRSNAQLSLRLCDDSLAPFPKNSHKITFRPYMTNEDFAANYAEIVRACGLLSDALLTFTRAHLGYRTRPTWHMVCSVNHS